VISFAALPTGLRGQIIALLLLIGVLGVAFAVIALPLVQLYDERALELKDRQALAQRLSSVTAELPNLHAKLATLRAAASRLFLNGSTDAIASANLQSKIQELATPTGATINSLEGLPTESRGVYRQIGLRVGLSGNYGAVTGLIAALENATPPLALDNLRFLGRTGKIESDVEIEASIEAYGARNDDHLSSQDH
jgi:general secretion pathway protein M